MPEHREGTPSEFRNLESFLWWDFDTLELWCRWAATRGGTSIATKAAYAQALTVQRALRTFAAANNGVAATAEAQRLLNQAIAERDLMPRVTIGGHLTFGSGTLDDPVSAVLATALRAIIDGRWARFKICRDTECRASYYDASRNSSKTWCSMDTCGSRNKMRRHRQTRPLRF